MPCYIITLEQNSAVDYTPLHQQIKAYGIWARITELSWAVVTDEKASEVRDSLTPFLQSGDRIFVVKSGVAAAWRNIRGNSEWFKKHL